MGGETPDSKLMAATTAASVPYRDGRKWQPRTISRFPFVGFGALGLNICCTVAAISVVLASNGSPTSALTGNRQPGVLLAYLISTACLLVMFTSLLRGPLMERAIFVQTETVIASGNIDLKVTHEIDEGWVASTTDRSYESLHFSEGFSTVMRQFQAKKPINVADARCDNCSLTVEAFGFQVDCTTNKAATGDRYLEVNVPRKATSDQQGHLHEETCLLKPAKAKYDVLLSASGTIVFQNGSWKNDSVVELISSRGQFGSYWGGYTVRALAVLGSTLHDSSSYIEWQGGAGWLTRNERILAATYSCGVGEDCETGSYRDPMGDVINSFREVALRMSVEGAYGNTGKLGAVASGKMPLSQTVTYISRRQEVQYAVDKGNLALGVVVVSLVGPLASLALFWGWWELGRTFTLSPLEVVNSFYAPPGDEQKHAVAASIAACYNGNATADEIVKYVREAADGGDPKVRYSVVGDRLLMALNTDGKVQAPERGDLL